MKLSDLFDFANLQFSNMALAQEPLNLFEPLEYCLKNGGKRVRPVLTLLGAHVFGAEKEKAINPAIGLELFHNFTLIHDDVMDDAHLRRGQPTVFKKWNTNTAILSGDALFAIASQYMTQIDDIHLRQMMELYHTTVIDVCKGQQYDMDFEKCASVSLDAYLEMIRLKTAVLPAACLKAGGIVANASASNLQKIYDFGILIGLAFQIKDDYLDLFGETAKFGKTQGGDIIANKKTWLYLKALEVAPKTEHEILTKAYHTKPENPSEKVATVKEIFLRLHIDKLALEEVRKYYRGAIEILNEVEAPDSRKELLRELAEVLVNREV